MLVLKHFMRIHILKKEEVFQKNGYELEKGIWGPPKYHLNWHLIYSGFQRWCHFFQENGKGNAMAIFLTQHFHFYVSRQRFISINRK